jgi:hypothetical protein
MITNIFKPIKVLKIQTDHKTGSHLPTPSYKKKKKEHETPLYFIKASSNINETSSKSFSLFPTTYTKEKKKKTPPLL